MNTSGSKSSVTLDEVSLNNNATPKAASKTSTRYSLRGSKETAGSDNHMNSAADPVGRFIRTAEPLLDRLVKTPNETYKSFKSIVKLQEKQMIAARGSIKAL